MILMMNKLMRWSGAVLAAAEAAVARFPQLFLPPPPVFCITICKIALLLSAFACMPSVLAQDIPLLTLQAKNIQVRAEWEKVGDAGNHFRLDGGTLVLTSTISGAGKPEGNAITVIVKVRDKFSTLNPSYKDLAVMVTIRAVIMGCRADKRREFAKSMARESADIPNQIIMREGKIVKGDVIARRYTEDEIDHIYLYTVSATHGGVNTKTFLTAEPIGLTEPTSLYESLDWDYDFNPPIMPIGWTWLEVNESEDCFAEEVNHFILTIHAPFVTGLYAGIDARVISVVASVSNNRQIFSLDDVELANALNELYPIKIINDNGKAFSIDGSSQNGNRYEYYANIPAGSTVTVQNNSPHEVIIFNGDCPPIDEVIAWQANDTFWISASDWDKVKEKKYVAINGTVYPDPTALYFGIQATKGIEAYILSASGFHGSVSYVFADGDHPIKFTDDHFICESI